MMFNNLFEYDYFRESYEVYHNKSGESFWGDQAAGIFIICEKTKRCLIGKRSQYVNEPGEWAIFGGMVDTSDKNNVMNTAKRELIEETDYDGNIRMVPAYVFTSSAGGFRYYNFIGLIEKEYEPRLDWETETFKWLTLDELKRIEPKHFGLIGLLDDGNSWDIIKKYLK